MSNRLFAANNPVVHCAPKRVRRTWWGTVLTVVTLLLLAALCGWLWICVRQASGQTWRLGDMETGRILAMAPVPQGMVFGLLLSLSVVGIVIAVRRVRQHDIEAELRWEARRNDECGMTNDELKRVRIGMEDLRQIVLACRAESRVALLFVEAALTTTDLDDYADALRAAHAKLAQVTRTLGDLHRSLEPEPAKAGTTNSEWPRVAAREDAS